MNILKGFWTGFQKVGFFIGNIISGVFLLAFYYSIFMIFAIPAKLSNDYLGSADKDSNWRINKNSFSSIEDFKNE